jgi:2'-5' RNA ligase
VLSPWAELPTAADLAELARITQAADPFDVQLARVGEFPDGVLYRIDLQWWANHACRRLRS